MTTASIPARPTLKIGSDARQTARTGYFARARAGVARAIAEVDEMFDSAVEKTELVDGKPVVQ